MRRAMMVLLVIGGALGVSELIRATAPIEDSPPVVRERERSETERETGSEADGWMHHLKLPAETDGWAHHLDTLRTTSTHAEAAA